MIQMWFEYSFLHFCGQRGKGEKKSAWEQYVSNRDQVIAMVSVLTFLMEQLEAEVNINSLFRGMIMACLKMIHWCKTLTFPYERASNSAIIKIAHNWNHTLWSGFCFTFKWTTAQRRIMRYVVFNIRDFFFVARIYIFLEIIA